MTIDIADVDAEIEQLRKVRDRLIERNQLKVEIASIQAGNTGHGLLQKILSAVSKRLDLSASDIMSASKRQHLAEARFMVCGLASKYSTLSSFQIAVLLSKRDHATILNAIKRCRDLIEMDDKFRNNYAAIEAELSPLTSKPKGTEQL